MLNEFTTQEILHWSDFCQNHEATLRNETQIFSKKASVESGKSVDTSLKHLQDRVTEHNIRVISAYYTQITLSRLAKLLSLNEEVSRLLVLK